MTKKYKLEETLAQYRDQNNNQATMIEQLRRANQVLRDQLLSECASKAEALSQRDAAIKSRQEAQAKLEMMQQAVDTACNMRIRAEGQIAGLESAISHLYLK